MKLLWSNRSPFVRKVWIVLHETGLINETELVRTSVDVVKPNSAVQSHNPLGKIPTLILADGSALYDSRTICEYLCAGRPKLFPAPGPARWNALQRQASGDGLMDLALAWRGERLRPENLRHDALMAAFAQKARTVLDRLESDAAGFAVLPFDIGHVAIGCALSYLDFRLPELEWRTGRVDLHAWHRSFEARPSVQATVIINDEAIS